MSYVATFGKEMSEGAMSRKDVQGNMSIGENTGSRQNSGHTNCHFFM